MIEYPYMMSNNKIPQIFEKIKTAGTPPKFTIDFLRRLGFTSTNDRAFIPLIKRLGFLTQDGTPTEYYSQLKNPSEFGVILAERIKDVYADLFSLNMSINTASDPDIKGAIARVTGKDEQSVSRYLYTFKALIPLANFNAQPAQVELIKDKDSNGKEEPAQNQTNQKSPFLRQEMVNFHYNIQIHLPATTDINIYNAIFKSIKDNLLDQ